MTGAFWFTPVNATAESMCFTGDEEKDGAAEAAASEEKKGEEEPADPVIPPGFAVAAERS